MPRSPAITMIGSPGRTRMKAKEISVTPRKVGTKVIRRERIYFSIGSRLLSPVERRSMAWSGFPRESTSDFVEWWAANDHPPLEMNAGSRRTPQGPSTLFGQAHIVEDVTAQRMDDVVLHFGPYRHEHRRVRDRHPRRLFLEDDLSLLIELRPVGLVGQRLGLEDQLVERLVAPLRAVGAADPVAAEKHAKEVVRIAVVAGPAQQHRTVAVQFTGTL